MGSAVTRRDDPWYRAAAELGRLLARAGYLVASGGGPGIMEAANLGAFLAPHDDRRARRRARRARPRRLPTSPGDDAYVAAATSVRERNLPGGESLAIPTWFYPGEPVGQFASHIAKYFANSIREDGLLSIAVSGIVFAPGRAGTTQELFQDAAQNAYGIRGRSPMVLLGREAYDGDPSLYECCATRRGASAGSSTWSVSATTRPRRSSSSRRTSRPRRSRRSAATAQEISSFMRNERDQGQLEE